MQNHEIHVRACLRAADITTSMGTYTFINELHCK